MSSRSSAGALTGDTETDIGWNVNVVILFTADNSFLFFKAKEVELLAWLEKAFLFESRVIVFLRSDRKRMAVCRYKPEFASFFKFEEDLSSDQKVFEGLNLLTPLYQEWS